jgi:hypothetical protein
MTLQGIAQFEVLELHSMLESSLCLVDVGTAARTWIIVMASGSFFATVAGIMLISVLLLPHTMPWLAVAFCTPLDGITIVVALISVLLLPRTMPWLAVAFLTPVVGIMIVVALISVLLLPRTMPWLAVAFFTPVVGIMIVIMFHLPMIAALLLPGTMSMY